MKLLFITEKPFLKKRIEENFEKFKDSVNYDIDVITVNCFITSIEDAERFHIDIKDFKDLYLESREVPKKYKIITDSDYYKVAGKYIASLVAKNKYDLLVNACDPDEAGELMFDYTRETCKLTNYNTARFELVSLYNGDILKAFQKLNNEIQIVS